MNSEKVRQCSRLARTLYIKSSKKSNLARKNLIMISMITSKIISRGNKNSIIGNKHLIDVRKPSEAMRIITPHD